jgi:hypothetical protein
MYFLHLRDHILGAEVQENFSALAMHKNKFTLLIFEKLYPEMPIEPNTK